MVKAVRYNQRHQRCNNFRQAIVTSSRGEARNLTWSELVASLWRSPRISVARPRAAGALGDGSTRDQGHFRGQQIHVQLRFNSCISLSASALSANESPEPSKLSSTTRASAARPTRWSATARWYWISRSRGARRLAELRY